MERDGGMALELPNSGIATPTGLRLDFRRLREIRSPAEYDAAIQAIHALFDKGSSRTTEEADPLEFLSVAAEAYEEEHVQMPSDAAPQG
jgi:antitoxin component HigA of HigAB toxin-antitoxin module